MRFLEEEQPEVRVLDVLFIHGKGAAPTFRMRVKPNFSILATKPASPPISSLSKRLFTSATYIIKTHPNTHPQLTSLAQTPIAFSDKFTPVCTHQSQTKDCNIQGFFLERNMGNITRGNKRLLWNEVETVHFLILTLLIYLSIATTEIAHSLAREFSTDRKSSWHLL